MIDAGRSAAGWLAGRILLFLLALAVLVLADVARDRNSTLRTGLDALVPDAELADRLEAQHRAVEQALQRALADANAALADAHLQPKSQLAERAAALDAEVRERESRRPSAAAQAMALATGNGVGDMVENEARIQLLRAERDQLVRIVDAMDALGRDPAGARRAVGAAAVEFQARREAYLRSDAALRAFERANPLALVPFEALGLRNATRATYLAKLAERNAAVREHNAAHARYLQAKRAEAATGAAAIPRAESLRLPESPLLEQFGELVADKRNRVELARQRLDEMRDRIARTAWAAFWVVVAVSFLPLVLKAFWYYVMAPLAARRRPIQLVPGASPTVSLPAAAGACPQRISAVSQDVVLGPDEELLVHPEYLQSTTHAGSKRTQWLLSRRLPFTSMASRLVALTRVRGAGTACTISSRKDPFSEVGLVAVPEGAALVLQPRALVGLVRRCDRPVRIVPRWNLSLGALITLQFRFLVFEGPVRLIVAGCRGIRQEPAGSGRSIDQNQTIGFSANLAYAPRRSETFGAYLLGVNGLFNDGFSGGPGVFVYEEMPYFGARGGIRGRGLQGATDVLLKFFGI